jgi:hypothetical protein
MEVPLCDLQKKKSEKTFNPQDSRHTELIILKKPHYRKDSRVSLVKIQRMI